MVIFYIQAFAILFQFFLVQGQSTHQTKSKNNEAQDESSQSYQLNQQSNYNLNNVFQGLQKILVQSFELKCEKDQKLVCFKYYSSTSIAICCQVTENIFDNNIKNYTIENSIQDQKIICFKYGSQKSFKIRQQGLQMLKINEIQKWNKDKQVDSLCQFFTSVVEQNNSKTTPLRRFLILKSKQNFTELPKQCWLGCYQCDRQAKKCRKCKFGYRFTQAQSCQPQLIVYLATVYLSLGFGTFQFAFILDIFISEFSYMEYYQDQAQFLAKMYGFIGTINREKIVPFYIQKLFQDLIFKLRQFKLSLDSQSKYYSESQNFLQKQQSSINYISNILFILTFNLPQMLLVYLFVRFLNKIFQKLHLKSKFLKTKSSFYGFIQTFMHINGQYLVFMFWKQIKNISMISFVDKISIVSCTCLTFFLLITTISIYPICKLFYARCSSKILFSYQSQKKIILCFISSIIYGPSKYILIGTISSSGLPEAIKFLLLLSASICNLAVLRALPPHYSSKSLVAQKISLTLISILYLTRILTRTHKKVQFYDNVAFTILIIIISLAILEILVFLLHSVIKILYFFSIRKSGMLILEEKQLRIKNNKKFVNFKINLMVSQKIQDVVKFEE